MYSHVDRVIDSWSVLYEDDLYYFSLRHNSGNMRVKVNS
jgi:hypothetical protein